MPRFKAKSKEQKPKPPRHSPPVNYLSIMIEMNHGDNRTAAIVASGLLENSLALLIMSRLRELDREQQKELFEREESALGSFTRKIQIGFALNLFNKDVKDDLNAIPRIRNQFAHHLYVRTFNHEEVREDCDTLIGPQYLAYAESRPETTDRRERVMQTAAHLASRFDLERKTEHRPPSPQIRSYETMELVRRAASP